MIIYNVTCTVESEIAGEWVEWMMNVHIPEVMATGFFHSWEMLRVISDQAGEYTYAIQYRCANHEQLQAYRREHAPGLMKKTAEKYGQKVLAFRTVLEILA